MEFFSWVKPCGEPSHVSYSCIWTRGMDTVVKKKSFCVDMSWTQAFPVPRAGISCTPVVTSPVSHVSCQQTPHFNLLHPHSLLCTCTLHGHPDLLTPYPLTARLCRDTGEARQARRRCTVPLENLTAKRHGVSPRRRREEWRTARDGPEELICGLGCERRHTANYWTRPT